MKKAFKTIQGYLDKLVDKHTGAYKDSQHISLC